MILFGEAVVNKLFTTLKIKQSNFVNTNKRIPAIKIFSNDNIASSSYLKSRVDLCNRLNIKVEILQYNNQDELINAIIKCNNDKMIDGIIVDRPLKFEIDESIINNLIDSKKDIDGVSYINMGKLWSNNGKVPATALAVMELLDFYNIDLEGKHVVIIGRSITVGKPLVPLFLNKNATVTICHSKSENLRTITKVADILVVAVGIREFIDQTYVHQHSVIIDVGINIVNKKIYGDVNKDVMNFVQSITPVPKGVGVVTNYTLLLNLLKGY